LESEYISIAKTLKSVNAVLGIFVIGLIDVFTHTPQKIGIATHSIPATHGQRQLPTGQGQLPPQTQETPFKSEG
jgi:hypothetical protein